MGRGPPGMLGLQTALGVVMLALGERFSWELAAERMSYAPAEIGRLRAHGRPLDPGAPANLTLVDPSSSWVVDPAGLASRSRNTPYAGREIPATIVATFLRGRADSAGRQGRMTQSSTRMGSTQMGSTRMGRQQ